MIAVILATGVAFANEYKSDREFEILNAQKESIHVKVIRDGDFHTVPLEEVVVGDVVELEMGDEIPADGRLVKATELYVDQSLMTGESEPVRKQARPADDTADGPEQPGCLYRGTQVVDGVGELVVTEVGDATYLGQIAHRLSAEDEEEEEGEGADTEQKRVKRKLTVSKELTPLQHKLEKLADLISKVGYVAAVAIFLALLIRGLIVGEVRWPRSGPGAHELKGHTSEIQAIAFSPDGTLLASAGWVVRDDLIGEVKIWDTGSGRQVRTLYGHENEFISALAFSADSRLLASGDKNGVILIREAGSDRILHTLPHKNDPQAGHTAAIKHLAFDAAGKRLASAGADKSVRIWDVATGQLLRLYTGHSDEVKAVTFSPDGTIVASGSADGVQ